MDELLTQIVKQCRRDWTVVVQAIEKGMNLLAYPMESGVLVAIGFDPDQSHRINVELIVRKRSESMERFGLWLPTKFKDGSCYLVRRIKSQALNGSEPVLPLTELIAAQELLT